MPEPGAGPGAGSRGPAESVERHIRVSRTARYRVLGDPESAAEVWFVLHGYGQLAERFVGHFNRLPGLGSGVRAVVAPEALSRFYLGEGGAGPHGPESRVGATWMTRADRDHEVRDYVEYLDRVAGEVSGRSGGRPTGGGERVVVLGFSQGAATASRWVVNGGIHPHELVLWGGGLAVDLADEALGRALAGVRIRLVAGARDGWGREKVEEAIGRLEPLRLVADRIDHPGGHRIDADVLARYWPV